LGPSSMTTSQIAAPGTPTSAVSQGPSSMSYDNNENISFGRILKGWFE